MTFEKPILGYWNIHGIGSSIRLFLEYFGVDYVDHQYVERSSWIDEDKINKNLGPFPNLPYFIDTNGIRITQSIVILEYLSRKYKLEGTTEQEKLDISLVVHQVADLNEAFFLVAYDRTERLEKLKEEYLKTVPFSLSQLSKFLSNKNYFAGKISMADFVVYTYLKRTNVFVPGSLDATPNLKEFIKRIESLSELSRYFQNYKPLLFNASHTKWNATG